MRAPTLPENAPFDKGYRAWLNGYFAGLVSTGKDFDLTIEDQASTVSTQNPESSSGPSESADSIDLDEAAWHDMSLSLDERMALVEDTAPLHHRLMAAMAQQDCGQCGYDCKGYSGALATGEESDPGLCVPGSKKTRKKVKALLSEGSASDTGEVAPPSEEPLVGYAKDKPYLATMKSVHQLNGSGSPKDTVHAVIDIKDSGLAYEPGDSLGVYARNNPGLVTGILSALELNAKTSIELQHTTYSVDDALTTALDITCPSDEALELLADASTDEAERESLNRIAEESLDDSPLDLYDILNRHKSARPDPIHLLTSLNTLRPRLYSISSSCKNTPDEVHLTVAAVRYQAEGRDRQGVASTFISDRAAGKSVPIYFQKAHNFALPEDSLVPIVMIGPGTGIAPFRAFLQERHQQGAEGNSWLFFGNPHEETDFLYREEFEAFLNEGVLSKLTTAFSRDSENKVYVQDRIVEQAEPLWAWIQSGTHIYVCGDATHMAAAVHEALTHVIEKGSGCKKTEASGYLANLSKEGRYQRDIY